LLGARAPSARLFGDDERTSPEARAPSNEDIKIMATAIHRATPAAAPISRAETLLRRYPAVSEAELAELIKLFQGLTLPERGVINNGALAAKASNFEQDHKDKLSASTVLLFTLLLLPVVFTALLLWWVMR
jgi:hypothetical protein